MLESTSIIRRGNHFLRFGHEWCLISGPWFDYLEALRGGEPRKFVRILEFQSFPLSAWEWAGGTEPPTRGRDWGELIWETRFWHPGWLTSPLGQISPRRFLSAREICLQDRWNQWQNSRKHIGYVLLPDGKLPPFLQVRNVPKDADWAWWDEVWRQDVTEKSFHFQKEGRENANRAR